ncbi:major facilitator transporter [Cupriavidus sp. GA3-3]|nr:major facilitator transporter [Cupriavidus sp. GA3-3]
MVAWQAGVGLDLAAGLAQIAFAAASCRRPPALAAT